MERVISLKEKVKAFTHEVKRKSNFYFSKSKSKSKETHPKIE